MRARVVACACALWVGGCLYPEYGVRHDGGSAGTGGPGSAGAGGRGGSAAGAAGVGGPGGSAVGVAGSAGGLAGSAAGRGGAAGSAAGSGGSAGNSGTPGTGGGGAGRGGGSAGTGGASAGNAGTGGGSAGKGGSGASAGTVGSGGAGTGGSAARGGAGGSAAGTGGGGAGRGGSSGIGGSAAGTGGSGTAGSTAAPSWLPSIDVVYQFDGAQGGLLGVEAHGNETLHLEEDNGGSILPMSDSANAIEGNSGKLTTLNGPAYFRSRSGAGLPGVFQTPSGASFTLGGWFRVDSSLSGGPHYLITDDGPGAYQGGFNFQLDQRAGSFGARAASAYCLIGVSQTGYDWNEVQTGNDVGADVRAGNRWVHLVCRYDAGAHTLTIFVGGAIDAQQPTTHDTRTGPGPFLLGCDQSFCQFLGNLDEVFFAPRALSDVDVNRIYACGIDGSRCRCSGKDYVSCGFAASCPGNLPDCNAATP